jgi:hypothetical protein
LRRNWGYRQCYQRAWCSELCLLRLHSQNAIRNNLQADNEGCEPVVQSLLLGFRTAVRWHLRPVRAQSLSFIRWFADHIKKIVDEILKLFSWKKK